MKSREELEEEVAQLRAIVSELTGEGEPVREGLTPTENKLYWLFKGAPGRVFTKDNIMDALYTLSPDPPDPKIVDIMVSKLRRKLPAGTIETVWGRGHRYVGHED